VNTFVRNAIAIAGLFLLASNAFSQSPVSAASGGEEKAFLSENDKVMTKMMNGMMAAPSGSVDNDFVSMMVPHHQGAMDMAQLELLYGHNEQLRRIAQEIIVEQQQEIIAMRLALGQPLPPSSAAPDQIMPTSPATALSVIHVPQDPK